MADIFRKFNNFNSSLLGKCTDVFSVKGKATAIKRKLRFYCDIANIDNLACFLLLQNFLEGNNLKTDQSVKSDIVRHLQELQKTLLQYFSEQMFNRSWVCNPFNCSTAPFAKKTMEEVIDDSNNGILSYNSQATTQASFG